MKIKVIVILVAVFIFNCKDSEIDCSTVDCAEMHYKIVLKGMISNENLLLKNEYTEEAIQILNTKDAIVGFYLHNGVITITPTDGIHGTHTLKVEDIEITYSYNFTKPDGSCCDFGDLTNVSVIGQEFQHKENIIEIFL